MAQRAVDWGTPRPADEWSGPRERVVTRLPADVAQALRERARSEGVSLSVLAGRLIAASMGMPVEDRIGVREPWPAMVDALIG